MYALQEHVSLKTQNTFGIDAVARWWFEVRDEEQALEFLMDNIHVRRQVLVLGGGSNLLLTGDIQGIVLKNAIRGIEVVYEDDVSVQVRVGAGENWHSFVLHCIERGWGGVENLSLIPGSVGASPIQNIGAYGVEICELLDHVEAMSLQTGSKRIFSNSECKFGYRDSLFKNEQKGKYLITRVVLNLSKKPVLNTSYGTIREELALRTDTPTIRDVSEVVCEIRRSKLPDPAEIGNAGSFFKNPLIPRQQYETLAQTYPDLPHYPAGAGQVKIPAAWMIEHCGWKGKRFDNYGVHKNQALVLVNYGGAKGIDVYRLSSEILDSVQNKFGIRLEREVNVIGGE